MKVFGNTPSEYKHHNDLELLQQFQETGNLEVLAVLYQRYMHLVYGVCLKYLKDPEESKDTVMQIFEKLVDKAPGQEIRNFKSWLYVVTKNHCLMSLRQRQKRNITEELFMEFSKNSHLNGEDHKYDEQTIIRAVEALSEEQRRCIELFFYQDKSYQQIAEKTGYELKKVKSYIQNGKRNLRIYLEKHEG